MTGILVEKLRRYGARLYPERQIIVRGHGELRFVVVSPRFQMAATVALFLGAIWIGFATSNVLFEDEILAARERRLAEMTLAYDSLNESMSAMQARFLATTRDLAERQRQIRALFTEKSEIDKSFTEGSTPAAGSGHQSSLLGRDDGGRLAQLGRAIDALKRDQTNLMAELNARTARDVERLQGILEITGLDVEAYLVGVDADAYGQGGPLILLGETVESPSDFTPSTDPFEQQLFSTSNGLSRLADLQIALRRLPLITPVDVYYVSSSFGRRRDPITKTLAMHSGIDLAGIRKSQVHATAPGVVTFAGRDGAYGNMVEIDHGNGITTRYGHLYRITVKRGDAVATRMPIGLMGNTGRSTGPHVHYEVWSGGKVQNPAKFFEAGRHVFENG